LYELPRYYHYRARQAQWQTLYSRDENQVYDVLEYLAAGMTHQEILEDFPYLTEEDILACLSYAADREKQTLALQP
jgi:Protein of unknown function (DUF433)